MLCLHFQVDTYIVFNFPWDLPPLNHGLFRNPIFIAHILCYLPVNFIWFLVWFHSDYRTQFIWFQLFSIAWGLFYHPFTNYFSYVLCILEKILCSVCWMECSINTSFILFVDSDSDILADFPFMCFFQFLRKLLLSVSVNLSVSPFNSVTFQFIHFAPVLFGLYKFKSTRSSW